MEGSVGVLPVEGSVGVSPVEGSVGVSPVEGSVRASPVEGSVGRRGPDERLDEGDAQDAQVARRATPRLDEEGALRVQVRVCTINQSINIQPIPDQSINQSISLSSRQNQREASESRWS